MWISIDQSSKAFKERTQALIDDEGWTLQQAKALDIQAQIFAKSTDAQASFANWADSLTRKKAELLSTLKNVQETIASALLPAFHDIVTTLQPVIEKVSESISLWFKNKENVAKLTETIKTIIWIFWLLFKAIWKVIWFLTKMWEMLWLVAFHVVQFVAATSEKIISFWNTIASVWNWIKEWTMSVFNFIKDFIQWIIDWIVWKFTAAFDKIKAILNSIKSIWWSITWAVSSAVSSTKNFLTWTKANWWDVSAWKSYLVWERWSETFVPKTDWTIVPNWSGVWSVSINMWWVTVNDSADEDRLVTKIKDELTRTIQLQEFGIS